MPWKPTDQMTREELVAQLEQLREVVERVAARIPQDPSEDPHISPGANAGQPSWETGKKREDRSDPDPSPR